MKIAHVETLLGCGEFGNSPEWQDIRKHIHQAVLEMEYPSGTGRFTINPVKHGNGVSPIKKMFAERLKSQKQDEWKLEKPIKFAGGLKPGNLDFMLDTEHGMVAIEWETGNISSSHRSMNKLALALVDKAIVGGVMLVASRGLYPYLTDRIGNIQELEPYLDMWKSINCSNGVFEIVVFEHDDTSDEVELLRKGKDGNAEK